MQSLVRRLRLQIRRLLQLDDTPESIARGVALGIFIAMTPTVGVQMILVAIVHTLCRANRIAGFVMVYISNPVTMIPIYWLDYAIGWLVLQPISGIEWLGYQHFAELFDLSQAQGLGSAATEFASRAVDLGVGIAGPLCLGGLILGTVCAVPTYPITLRLIRQQRQWRQSIRQRIESSRLERTDDNEEPASTPTENGQRTKAL